MPNWAEWLTGVVLAGLGGLWLAGHWLLRRRVARGLNCPRCGQDRWHRRHRQLADLAFGWGINVRRFRCGNPECNWEGLRLRNYP
jgi:hypothetical protein